VFPKGIAGGIGRISRTNAETLDDNSVIDPVADLKTIFGRHCRPRIGGYIFGFMFALRTIRFTSIVAAWAIVSVDHEVVYDRPFRTNREFIIS